MPSYIERLEGQGRHGTASERRLAKKMGSRLQPASGALAHAKSDAKLKGLNYKFRIESKSTVNLTLPIDLAWLSKISNESMQDASIPLMTFSFVTSEGKPRSANNAEWVAMPLAFFEELKEAAERGKGE